jgi:hypothetical protein
MLLQQSLTQRHHEVLAWMPTIAEWAAMQQWTKTSRNIE